MDRALCRFYFESENPATGEAWYETARATSADVDSAIGAAYNAFKSGPWSNTSPTERGQMLYRLADVIATHAEELAEIEARDNGKLLREMKAQMRSLPEYFRFYAGLADKIRGDLIQGVARNALNYTLREPLGVVVAITAWNSPLYLAAMKLAPALAMGNTVVLKPSEYTSATTLKLASYFTEASFPDGVVNAISGYGREIGDALVDDRRVEKIAFTGSTPVGRRIAARAGDRLIKVAWSWEASHPISYSPTLTWTMSQPVLWQAYLPLLGKCAPPAQGYSCTPCVTLDSLIPVKHFAVWDQSTCPT